MRDDLSSLFQKLIIQYKNKIELLEIITSNETQLRFYLKSNNVSAIHELVQADNDLFLKLDTLEYEIQSLIDNICKISGIEKHRFNSFFLKKSDNPMPDLNKAIIKVNKLMSELLSDRDRLITAMEEKLGIMENDIASLKIIQKLK